MNDLEKEQYSIQQELLNLLGEIQRNTAPIVISIGYVNRNNTVCSGLMIKEAPPAVTKKLTDAGYSMDITADGVRVYKI